jgi:hypothetical protein
VCFAWKVAKKEAKFLQRLGERSPICCPRARIHAERFEINVRDGSRGPAQHVRSTPNNRSEWLECLLLGEERTLLSGILTSPHSQEPT